MRIMVRKTESLPLFSPHCFPSLYNNTVIISYHNQVIFLCHMIILFYIYIHVNKTL